MPDTSTLVGTVWRKDGPFGWLRVVGESFDGDGISGVSVQFRNEHRRWLKERWFLVCSSHEEFEARQRESCRYRGADWEVDFDA